MPAPTHQRSFVLTVAESKRLIARALKRHALVMKALNQGIVAVAKGTTNAYVAEELSGEAIHKPHYCMGVTKPARAADDAETANQLPDLVLRHGERQHGVSVLDILSEMGPGDVFVKGANAINYDKRQAAILVGHPTGGTMGAALGTLVARRAALLIPVGLEKNVPGDLHEACRRMAAVGPSGEGPMLWPIDGEIFTEIEAVQLLSGGQAALIGAGGIAGAEGSVRLSVWGTPNQVDRARGAVQDILGEPPFIVS
ncbi:MAG: hypothetical protein AMK73_03520 [Planctomycetes bacterium SM23_32]|nr:MAG: hypothetical protein AMK73_03520 [Planctomycetes bacterium SM23_32]